MWCGGVVYIKNHFWKSCIKNSLYIFPKVVLEWNMEKGISLE
jgi:hypothetical protein